MTFMQSIGHMWSSITSAINSISGNTFIGKTLIAAGALLTAYFTPIVGLLATCFATSFVDMIYGIQIAKKQHCKITSDKTRSGTWNKIKAEFAIIGLARMLEFTVLGTTGVFVLTGGATVIITLTELWSILENLNTLYPNGPWRSLGKYLKKKGEAYTGMELDLEKHDKNDSDNSKVSNGASQDSL